MRERDVLARQTGVERVETSLPLGCPPRLRDSRIAQLYTSGLPPITITMTSSKNSIQRITDARPFIFEQNIDIPLS